MIRIELIILTTLLLTFPFRGNSQTVQEASLSFPNYGPVAFDAFWRLPDDHIGDHTWLSLSSRSYSDWRNSTFFTQYFRLDLPIGSGHSFTLRMPLQHFRVDPVVATALDMDNATGTEFGDIDVIFTIRFLKKWLDAKTNERLALHLTGEMHTAPTGRENKQFTDALKMLGTLNASYVLLNREKHMFQADLLVGGGGWDDLIAPYQKHAAKLSSKLDYRYQLKNGQQLGLLAGGTYVYAQGVDNQGIYWKTGVNYGKKNSWQFGLNYGRMTYFTTPETNSVINQFEFKAEVPLKW